MIKLKTKKAAVAGETILWFYRIIIIIIVFSGVAVLSAIFYSKQVDVRQVEASILSGRIIDCISPLEFQNFNQDAIKNCINLDINEEYIKLILSYEDSGEKNEKISLGASELDEMCQIKEKFKHAPECLESLNYVVFKKDDKILTGSLYSLVAIKKIEKNII